MKVTETTVSGCFILEPKVFGDPRGYFFESFNTKSFKAAIGAEVNFVQDNQSFSSKGVLRGLHAQKGEFAQAKLVRVLQGAVLDVAVDARRDSPTFGQHVAVELSSENKKQLFVPRGFLHGFIVLTDTAEFFYKCDNYYNKDAEWGVKYNDDQLDIDWQLPSELFKLSEKDMILPSFSEAVGNI